MGADSLAIEALHHVESDGAIFEPRVDGFALWPVVRYRAWQLLCGVEPEVMSGSVWRRALRRPRELTRPYYAARAMMQRRALRKRHFDFVFLSSENYRAVERTDGWWDVYLDDIACHPELAGRICRIEERTRTVSPRRTVAPRHLFTDHLLLRQAADAAHPDAELDDLAGDLVEKIQARLSAIDAALAGAALAEFTTFCRRHAKMFRRGLAYYARLFDDVTPRGLVLMNAYGHHGAVAAARARGLPVVEFQHGVIHRDHPGYIWSDAARRVADALPIPTAIATWGEFWSGILLRAGYWENRHVHAVGSTRMDWLRNRLGDAGGAPDDVLHIVFTTQHPTREAALAVLDEFLALTRDRAVAVNLTLKVHPIEQPHLPVYRDFAAKHPEVRVLAAREADTLALIAAADVHVSGWSTCHYEAIGLGTPTVVLQFPGPNRTADMADLPGVRWVTGAAELLAAVCDMPPARDAAGIDRAAADALFRRGAVASAAKLLGALARC
jgi:hypothetical protein